MAVRHSLPWMASLFAGLLLLQIASTGPLHRWVRNRSLAASGVPVSLSHRLVRALGRRYSSVNLCAQRPPVDPGPARPVLYLMAHYDSKSQYLPLPLRIGLFAVAILGSLAFAGLMLLGGLLDLPGFSPWPLGGLAILASLPLLFLGEENDSPGAIDDAAGVGLVLHLAELVAADPRVEARLDVRPVITSAEEWALMGSSAFARDHAAGLRRLAHGPGLHVLNFDGVGVDGRLYLVEGGRPQVPGGGPRLAAGLRSIGHQIGEPVGRFPAIGALFDHIPLAESGLDAVSLISIGRTSASVHTPKDTPDKLSLAGFERAGSLVCRLIEELASAPDSPQTGARV